MQFFEQLSRKQKLMLIGAGGCILIALFIFIIVAAVNKANQPPKVTPTPTAITTPAVTPTEMLPEITATPSPTPEVVTPPESEIEKPTPTPEPTPSEPNPETTKASEVDTSLPSGTSKPSVTPAPSGTAKPAATPKPAASPKGSASPVNTENKAVERFSFALPQSAYTDTMVQVVVIGDARAAAWSVTRNEASLPLHEAFSGSLAADGGFITFKAQGQYVLTGRTASGKEYTANITIQKRV